MIGSILKNGECEELMADWMTSGKRKKREYLESLKRGCIIAANQHRELSWNERKNLASNCFEVGKREADIIEDYCSIEITPKTIFKGVRQKHCVVKELKRKSFNPQRFVDREAERIWDEKQTNTSDDFSELREFCRRIIPAKVTIKFNSRSENVVSDSNFKQGIKYTSSDFDGEFLSNSKKFINKKAIIFAGMGESVGLKEAQGIVDMTGEDPAGNIFRTASANEQKKKKKLICKFEHPYFSGEEEIRCELFNTILEKVQDAEVFDSGIDRSNEYVYIGRFPFVPQTGDILYKKDDKFKSIEIKFTKMYPQRDSKVKGKYYRVLRPLRIQPGQLELIEKGLMTLLLIGELVESPEMFGIAMEYGESAKFREACLNDIGLLRKAYGRNELGYTYLIIDQENFEDYREYFDNLKLVEKKEGEKVIGYRKTIRFPKLYRELTPSKRRFRALRSGLSREIVMKIFFKAQDRSKLKNTLEDE